MKRITLACSRLGLLTSLAVAALLAGGGCSVERKARTQPELEAHKEAFLAEMVKGRTDMSRRMVACMIARQDQAKAAGAPEPIFNFLILSGGGDYGSFGAGILKGWGT